mmetsp:Transcript_5078/g.18339  ORF Transcript_5078/g.18339 Transcript_5078/m.18339 type:complete len:494 (+) Transcript_5078:1-1482(+)
MRLEKRFKKTKLTWVTRRPFISISKEALDGPRDQDVGRQGGGRGRQVCHAPPLHVHLGDVDEPSDVGAQDVLRILGVGHRQHRVGQVPLHRDLLHLGAVAGIPVGRAHGQCGERSHGTTADAIYRDLGDLDRPRERVELPGGPVKVPVNLLLPRSLPAGGVPGDNPVTPSDLDDLHLHAAFGGLLFRWVLLGESKLILELVVEPVVADDQNRVDLEALDGVEQQFVPLAIDPTHRVDEHPGARRDRVGVGGQEGVQHYRKPLHRLLVQVHVLRGVGVAIKEGQGVVAVELPAPDVRNVLDQNGGHGSRDGDHGLAHIKVHQKRRASGPHRVVRQYPRQGGLSHVHRACDKAPRASVRPASRRAELPPLIPLRLQRGVQVRVLDHRGLVRGHCVRGWRRDASAVLQLQLRPVEGEARQVLAENVDPLADRELGTEDLGRAAHELKVAAPVTRRRRRRGRPGLAPLDPEFAALPQVPRVLFRGGGLRGEVHHVWG